MSDAGAVYVGLTSLALILLVIGAGVRANTIAGARFRLSASRPSSERSHCSVSSSPSGPRCVCRVTVW